MNLAKILENAASYFPDRAAVLDAGKEFSYSDFNREANRIATALLGKGIAPGDPIALLAPNSYRWLAFYFGVLKAGAVPVTLSNALTSHELPKILNDCKPRMLFTTDEKVGDLGKIGDYHYLKNVICDGGSVSYGNLLEEGSDEFRAVQRSRDDPAVILYTTGTTGDAKGAVLTHQNILSSVNNISYNERTTETDRCLCCLPLNHVFAQVHIANSTIFSAASLVVQPSFDMERVIDTIKHLHITKFFAVPTIYIRLLNRDDVGELFKSVRYCFSAAASMAAEVVKEWKARTGLKIFEAYGMTESSAMVTFNHYHQHVVGSVGTPVNMVEVQVMDSEGNPMPMEQEGEICISGPNIMKEYLNKPEATRASFHGEWFRSGDIGILDDRGYLFLIDRLKDLIITGGENVYPREIEEILYTRDEVQECAVIGRSDREYGERVVAYIVPHEGKTIDPGALKAYLAARLSRYKVPKEFISVAELPKSNTGKILKRELRKQAQNPV